MPHATWKAHISTNIPYVIRNLLGININLQLLFPHNPPTPPPITLDILDGNEWIVFSSILGLAAASVAGAGRVSLLISLPRLVFGFQEIYQGGDGDGGCRVVSDAVRVACNHGYVIGLRGMGLG